MCTVCTTPGGICVRDVHIPVLQIVQYTATYRAMIAVFSRIHAEF